MRKTVFFVSKNTPAGMFFSFLSVAMAPVAYVECGACSKQRCGCKLCSKSTPKTPANQPSYG